MRLLQRVLGALLALAVALQALAAFAAHWLPVLALLVLGSAVASDLGVRLVGPETIEMPPMIREALELFDDGVLREPDLCTLDSRQLSLFGESAKSPDCGNHRRATTRSSRSNPSRSSSRSAWS